jgi:hypothetical protein
MAETSFARRLVRANALTSFASRPPYPPLPVPVRRPLIYWPAVGATVAGSLLLVAALVALTPHRRHALAEPDCGLRIADCGLENQAEPSPERAASPSPGFESAIRNPQSAIAEPTPEPQASAPPPNPPEVVEAPPPDLTDVAVALPPGCQRYRTAVNFYDSPSEARAKAREEDKLVFVLHVAGNFEEPGFT